jgi:hypothetical protein
LLVTYGILALACLPLTEFGLQKALLALLAATAMVVAKSFYLPSYNEFTALFFLLTALGLYYGLTRRRPFLIFLGGMAAGVSIFARLPNLAVFGIVVAIFFYRLMESGQPLRLLLRKASREAAVFSVGFVAGILAIGVLMMALGHLSAYIAMLRQMSVMFGDSSQHHGGGRLFRGLLHDYFYLGVNGIMSLAAGIIILWIARRLRHPFTRMGLIAFAAAVLSYALVHYENLAIYFWPGWLCAILFAGAFDLLRLGKDYRLLCVLAALILFLTPLGSNNGIYNAVYAMFLAVSVAVVGLIGESSRVEEASLLSRMRFVQGLTPSQSDKATIGQLVICSVFVYAAVYRWQFTYRDSADRFAMQTGVDHPKLRAVFTTQSRAKAMEELLKQLQSLVHKDDYVFDHMQVPLIYFLTETRPYLYSSWANIYEPPVFERAMKRALSNRKSLPVCVMTKVDTSHREWPDKTYPLLPYYRHTQNRRVVESFLQDHSYKKHWENGAFQIWLPPNFDGKS